MDFFFIAVTLTVSFLVSFFIHKRFFSDARRRNKVPEAAGAWPIIGHLRLLTGPQAPHKILAHMAEKYGPIFRLKLGVHQVVVVSDYKIAKECFTTNDLALANRPKSIAFEIIGYNYAMFGLGPYGTYWREMRKIVTIEFLSTRRVEMFSHIREFELKSAITETYRKCCSNGSVKMEMKEWFGKLIVNTMAQMIFGVRYTSDEDKVITRFVELMVVSTMADCLPYLRWLDIGGHEKAMKEITKEMDTIVENWLAEHRGKRKLRGVKSGDEQDFMDVMLSVYENKDLPGFDSDTIIKATCLALISAGTDTTIVTLTWALSLLLNNYQALQKAQDELDAYVGKNRNVRESDIKNLVYLQAIVKEALRLYPAAPLLLSHECIEDCVISGYDIPKGTRLLVNA